MKKKNEKVLVPQCLSNLAPSKRAFTLAEGATHVGVFDNCSRCAFTLAEVLITLGIIGVVAAMTIPTLITNYNQRSWDTGATVFNRKLGEALKVMNSQSSLTGFSTTKDFIGELSKHVKISNICDSDNLTNCFTSEIFTTGDSIDTTELKEAKNLYSTEDYGTETVGVQFADGVTALIAYNPKATQDPYSNQIVRITGSGKSVGLSTDAISILYDVSGLKSPNEMGTSKDIREINISIETGADFKVLEVGSYAPVNCADPTSDGYEYCNANDIQYASEIGDNYWVGAQYACAKQNMHLSTVAERGEFYTRRGQDGIPRDHDVMCAPEVDATTISIRNFAGGYTFNIEKNYNFAVAICVRN